MNSQLSNFAAEPGWEGKTISSLKDDIRESFAPGILDEQQIKEFFINFYYADRLNPFRCLYCGHEFKTDKPKLKFLRGEDTDCIRCRRRFSWKTFTPFKGTSLKPSEIYLLYALSGAGLNERSLCKILGRDLGTIRKWRNKK